VGRSFGNGRQLLGKLTTTGEQMSKYEIEYPTLTPGGNERVAAEAVREVLEQFNVRGNWPGRNLSVDWLRLAASRIQLSHPDESDEWESQTVGSFVVHCNFVEVQPNPQLDRIEAKLDAIAAQFAELAAELNEGAANAKA
jgi:hypothetical protein